MNEIEQSNQIVAPVVRQFQIEYGETKGFQKCTIRQMMKFAAMFPNIQIVSTMLSKLSWSR